MPHPFRIETSVEIEATPEEVWEALTIGDKLDGWWIGAPNEVEPRLGGTVRQTFGGEVSESLGDDWESEYEALAEGDPMYIHQLAEYVRFFRGRPVAIVEHFQPDITDRQAAMAILRGAIGLGDAVALGDAVRLEPAGLGPVEGSVDYVSSTIIGLRTDDALYRFAFIPMGGGIYLGHHVYRDDVDVAAVTSAWAAWLDRAVAAGQAASAH
jgi:hypothetical protein